MDTQPVFVVSGLPRSGTSLMMQMLAAGGLPTMTDGVRQDDPSNPRGYMEYEPVKKMAQDAKWLGQARGRAIKIILQLLPFAPADIPLKVLVMDRPLDEVVKSQFAMLRSMGTQPTSTEQVLATTFKRQREAILAKLQARPNVQLLSVPFHQLLAEDGGLVDQIIEFIGVPGLDREAMLKAVDAGLYRSRSSDGPTKAARQRLPWQSGKCEGLIVVSVPKSGTNFLSRYLSTVTGWPHRWGRPSRDSARILDELPRDPDPQVARAASHLIQTPTDIIHLPVEQRPKLFGNRSLVSLEPLKGVDGDGESERDRSAHEVIAEHPLRSLPWLLRNPRDVPLLQPAEVTGEAESLKYGVVFLYRDLKDIVNSLGHFLFAGTRFVKFPSLEAAMETTVNLYAPPLAAAIRLWKQQFSGVQLTYEELVGNTRQVCQRLIDEFELPVTKTRLIESSEEFRTFTFRKGGTGDWRNHLSPQHIEWIDQTYPDLTNAG